jgi:hypothetical protein
MKTQETYSWYCKRCDLFHTESEFISEWAKANPKTKEEK